MATQTTLTPKEFIQKVLIDNIGDIHLKYPYLAFAPMAIGIEFLGKALNSHEDWNYYASGVPRQDFELAINSLTSFQKYRPLLTSNKLWDALRNGFSHSFVPKGTLSLSSGTETAHLVNVTPTKINLRCEDLYIDFKGACEEVIAMDLTSFASGKMGRPLLSVPPVVPDNLSYSGTT